MPQGQPCHSECGRCGQTCVEIGGIGNIYVWHYLRQYWKLPWLLALCITAAMAPNCRHNCMSSTDNVKLKICLQLNIIKPIYTYYTTDCEAIPHFQYKFSPCVYVVYTLCHTWIKQNPSVNIILYNWTLIYYNI